MLCLRSLNSVVMGKFRACCGLIRQFGKESSAVFLRLDNDCISAKEQSPAVSIGSVLTYMEHV